jgi:addiction module RelE/StbE family toxin
VDHRVVWSPTALEDLDAIAAYIARDSRRYASAVTRRFRDTARKLRQFPLSGRVVPELEDERIRQKIVYSWRMIYRFDNEVVTIAAIVHSRQSFETGLGRVPRT